MPSTYPSSVETFPTRVDGENVLAAHMNAVQDSITAIETELGTDPSGGAATVAAALAGKAASVHTHAAGDILSGVLATARLGTGVASSSTYLRGDGVWSTLAGGGTSIPTYPCIRVAANDAPASWKTIADYVCDGTADQTELNNAQTAARAGQLDVQLSPGTFNCSGTFWLQHSVRTFGRGSGNSPVGTVIKQADGANLDALVGTYVSNGTDSNAHRVHLEAVRLDGNRSNQTAGLGRGLQANSNPLWAASTGDTEWDMLHRFVNVHIWNCRGDGFYGEGRSENDLLLVYVRECSGNGFAPSTDTQMTLCISAVNGLSGFKITNPSNRLDACKAWWNGQVTPSPGFQVNDVKYGTTVLSSCEAQDNWGPGLSIESSQGVNFQGGFDSNSRSSAGAWPAVDLWDARGNIITGTCVERRTTGGPYFQQNAIRIRSNSVGNWVHMTHAYMDQSTPGSAVMSGSTTTNNRGSIATISGTGASWTDLT